MRRKNYRLLLTADDVPMGQPAAKFLDELANRIGAQRGYGGKNYGGHWLLRKRITLDEIPTQFRSRAQ